MQDNLFKTILMAITIAVTVGVVSKATVEWNFWICAASAGILETISIGSTAVIIHRHQMRIRRLRRILNWSDPHPGVSLADAQRYGCAWDDCTYPYDSNASTYRTGGHECIKCPGCGGVYAVFHGGNSCSFPISSRLGPHPRARPNVVLTHELEGCTR